MADISLWLIQQTAVLIPKVKACVELCASKNKTVGLTFIYIIVLLIHFNPLQIKILLNEFKHSIPRSKTQIRYLKIFLNAVQSIHHY
jgi:hypothetical protein